LLFRGQRSGGLQFETSPGQIVHETLSQKSSSQKWAGDVSKSVGPDFKPQYFKMGKLTKTENWPSYSGDNTRKRHCSKPVRTKTFANPILTNNPNIVIYIL
jgi:hypothetical protein